MLLHVPKICSMLTTCINFFFQTHVLFFLGGGGHWYPCFGFLVTSPLGFKVRVGSALFAFCRGECNVHSLRSTSGATHADLSPLQQYVGTGLAAMPAAKVAGMYQHVSTLFLRKAVKNSICHAGDFRHYFQTKMKEFSNSTRHYESKHGHTNKKHVATSALTPRLKAHYGCAQPSKQD